MIMDMEKLIPNKEGENFPSGRGMQRGDPLSPISLIAVLEEIFRNRNWKSNGVKK